MKGWGGMQQSTIEAETQKPGPFAPFMLTKANKLVQFAKVYAAVEPKCQAAVRYIYPHDKVVVLKACPGVIKLDPALMFKYLTADGFVQLIHIQVEIPTVLVDFCTGWGTGDGLTTFGHAIEEIYLKKKIIFWMCRLSRMHSLAIISCGMMTLSLNEQAC